MNTTFMNSKNSKTSDPHSRLLNLTDRVNLKESGKYVTLLNFISMNYAQKIIKVI